MRRGWLFLFITLLFGLVAMQGDGQVQQSGSVTAGHAAYWVYDGILGDAGPATNGLLTELGIVKNGGLPFCVSDFPITNLAGYAQLCLAQSNTEADIFETSFNSAQVPIYLDYNGTKYDLLAQISSIANVTNIATLRGGDYSKYTTLNVVAYYDTNYQGGGLFTRGACGSNIDNGGTVIQDSAGNCWFRQRVAGTISQDVLAWGAHCDGIGYANDGSMSLGSNQFTSTAYTFQGSDVGKYLEVDPADASPFLTTITGVNGHTATLAYNSPVAYPGNYTLTDISFQSTVDGGADNPGTGYVPNPSVSLTVTGGTPISAATFFISATALVSVTQTSGGSGYAVNDTISLTSATAGTVTASAAIVQVTSVGGGGAITGFSIISGGSYRSNSSHINPSSFTQTTNGIGSGWTFNLASSNGSFGIARVVFQTGGSYSVPPPLLGSAISGGTGTGGTVDTTSNAGTWASFSDDTTALQAAENYAETTGTRGVYDSILVPSGNQCYAQSVVINGPISWTSGGPRQGFVTMILGSTGQSVNNSRPAFFTMATGAPFDAQGIGENEPIFSNIQINGESDSQTVYVNNQTITTTTDCFELVTPGSLQQPHANTGMIFRDIRIQNCPGHVVAATIWSGEILGYNVKITNAGIDCLHFENASNPTRFFRLVVSNCTQDGLSIYRSGAFEFFGAVIQKATLPVSITGIFGQRNKNILFNGADIVGSPYEGMYLDQASETVRCISCTFKSNNLLGDTTIDANDSDIVIGPDSNSGQGIPVFPVLTLSAGDFDSNTTASNVFFSMNANSNYCECVVVADGTTQNINQGQLTTNNAALMTGGQQYFAPIAPIAPTIASGFGTSPSVSAGSGTNAFQITVGSGGVATTGTLTLSAPPLAAAPHGWVCVLNDVTHAVVTTQTGSSTTTASFTGASAWTAADKLVGSCNAF